MEFLNPSALFGFLALPLLVIPYLIRRKPRRVVFSSLLLLMESGAQASGRPWGKINLPPVFFLQLLLLALLIFALSEPVFSVRPSQIAIVLDNSASMQTLENGQTRFALAKEKAGGILNELGVAGAVDLYLTTPRLDKVNPKPMTAMEAKNALGGQSSPALQAIIDAYDLGDPLIDYNDTLNRLIDERKYQRLYLITDHPGHSQGTTVRFISVGTPKANFAVTAFDVHRSSLIDGRLEASAEVANYSAKDEKIKLSLRSGSTILAHREAAVSAGKTVALNFEGLAEKPYYEVAIDTQDALALDNRRFTVAPPSRNLKILAVTPRPQAVASLKSIAGISVDVVAPGDYGKARRDDYGLEIFHYSSPTALPHNPALFILPPDSNSLVDLGAPVTNIVASSWREAHTLTRYINFALFRPSYARPLKPQTAGELIIDSPNGPLAFASQRQDVRYLSLGFDPLPYLGRDNLPMSIFTLNFLDWFLENGGTKGEATGEPIALRAPMAEVSLLTPRQQRVVLKSADSYFFATYFQGIYQVNLGRDAQLFARNLRDSNESDLRSPGAIELKGAGAAADGSSVLFSFWPYVLLAALALLLLEWFINPRMQEMPIWRKVRGVAWKS